MKLVTCCSFKGGAGKTTILMGLCTSLVANGKPVALFEADENRPLTRWRENGIVNDAWDQACEVFVADELPLLESAYETAERRGYEYALVDTHGGSSELNNTIIASSDFLVVPTMLTPLDIDEALATYRYIVELLMVENLQIETAILQQRVPVGKLTQSQKAAAEMLSVLPLFNAPMHERDAFAAMKDRGMLHMTLRNIASNAAMRLQQRNHQTAMDELASLTEFVEKALGE
jgi:cellulose biosynthesis protein BcsQ